MFTRKIIAGALGVAFFTAAALASPGPVAGASPQVIPPEVLKKVKEREARASAKILAAAKGAQARLQAHQARLAQERAARLAAHQQKVTARLAALQRRDALVQKVRAEAVQLLKKYEKASPAEKARIDSRAAELGRQLRALGIEVRGR